MGCGKSRDVGEEKALLKSANNDVSGDEASDKITDPSYLAGPDAQTGEPEPEKDTLERAPMLFKVILTRQHQDEIVGMLVDQARAANGSEALVVREVKTCGMAYAWNMACTELRDMADFQLRPGDIIVDVNGVSKRADAMRAKLKLDSTLILSMQRTAIDPPAGAVAAHQPTEISGDVSEATAAPLDDEPVLGEFPDAEATRSPKQDELLSPTAESPDSPAMRSASEVSPIQEDPQSPQEQVSSAEVEGVSVELVEEQTQQQAEEEPTPSAEEEPSSGVALNTMEEVWDGAGTAKAAEKDSAQTVFHHGLVVVAPPAEVAEANAPARQACCWHCS